MNPAAGDSARSTPTARTSRSSFAARAARAVALLGALASIHCSSGDDDDDDGLPVGSSGAGGSSGAAPNAGAPQAGAGRGGSGNGGTSGAGSNASGAGSGGRGGTSTTLAGSGGKAGAGEGGTSPGTPTAGRGGQSGGNPSGGGGTSGSNNAGRGGRGSGGAAQGGSGGTLGGGGGTSGGSSGASSGQGGEFAGTLEAHNAVRAAVETSNPLPPLTWSDALAAVAQDWAETLADECDSIHHRMPNDYGENIAAQWSRNGSAGAYGPQAVEAWAAEIDCWTFGTIAGTEMCVAECIAEQNSNGCGHYTQLVWRTTLRVGCGYASCRRQDNSLMEIFVCNYDPPGNYRGRAPY